jgi:RNA polymerase sigma factor (sigma-70 family)
MIRTKVEPRFDCRSDSCEVRTKVEDHIPLVYSITRKFIPLENHSPIEDTEEFSDGMLGLTRAWGSYDESRSTVFSTFAYHCIFNEICKGLKTRKKSSDMVYMSDFKNFRAREPLPMFEIKDLAQELLKRYPVDRETDVTNKLILMEHYLEGKKQTEIARELEISKEAVRQRKNKAIEMVKRIHALIG